MRLVRSTHVLKPHQPAGAEFASNTQSMNSILPKCFAMPVEPSNRHGHRGRPLKHSLSTSNRIVRGRLTHTRAARPHTGPSAHTYRP